MKKEKNVERGNTISNYQKNFLNPTTPDSRKKKPDMRDSRLLSYPLHQEIFNFDHKWIITFSVRV